jgi:type I restriction enzyme R subunit
LKAFDKKRLSEIDICDLFNSPAIKDAGLTQIRREVTLAPGPVVVLGNRLNKKETIHAKVGGLDGA